MLFSTQTYSHLIKWFLDTLVDASSPSPIRIGIPVNYLCSNLEPEVDETFARMKLHLSNKTNVKLIDIDMLKLERLSFELGFKIGLYETRAALKTYLADYKTGMATLADLAASVSSPDVKDYIDRFVVDNAPNEISPEQYYRLKGFEVERIICAEFHI